MNQYYVCTFEKLANYKEGQGNTATYFLTPDRKVLNIAAGKLNNTGQFLKEAKRARFLANTSAPTAKHFYETIATESERSSIRRSTANLLAANPFPKVESVYWIVFSETLGERMDYEMK